jgi:hypothetical protein
VFKKRWWIRETYITEDAYKVMAGPRFWRYRKAREAARSRSSIASSKYYPEYKYIIMRITDDTPEDGTVMMTSKKMRP